MKKAKSITMAAITALTLLVGATESQAGYIGYQPVAILQPVYVPTLHTQTVWECHGGPFGQVCMWETRTVWY